MRSVSNTTSVRYLGLWPRRLNSSMLLWLRKYHPIRCSLSRTILPMAVAHDPLPMMAMLPGKLEGIRGAGEGRNRRVIFLRIDINNAKKKEVIQTCTAVRLCKEPLLRCKYSHFRRNTGIAGAFFCLIILLSASLALSITPITQIQQIVLIRFGATNCNRDLPERTQGASFLWSFYLFPFQIIGKSKTEKILP